MGKFKDAWVLNAQIPSYFYVPLLLLLLVDCRRSKEQQKIAIQPEKMYRPGDVRKTEIY